MTFRPDGHLTLLRKPQKSCPQLIDELLKVYQNPEELMGEGGILKQLTKALVERCLTAEIDTHLQQSYSDRDKKNRRNGHSKKTIKEEFGEVEIGVPRDWLCHCAERNL